MNKKTFANKFWLVAALSLILIMPSTDAFAWGGYRSLPPRHEIVVVGRERYHYHNGRFYKRGFFGFFVVAPRIGAIVTVLPFGHRTIVVAGVTYYYYDNVYYRAHHSGYVVVPAPVVNSNFVYLPAVIQSQELYGETVTVNVPNSNGSYTPVTLTKRNNGYIGPQGEYYPAHPTVDQLKALYGK